MNNKGFTLIELMIVLFIIGIISGIVSNSVLNNRSATEKRAYANAQLFLQSNGLGNSTLNCAGDSQQDGYGTCVVSLENGKRLMLQCPTDYFDVTFFGATGCKEVFNDLQY